MTNFISKYSWSSISGTCTFKIVTFIFLKSWGKIFNKITNLTWYKKLTDIKRDEHTPSHYPCWRLHVKKMSSFTSVKGKSHVNHKIRGVTPSLFSRQSYSLYLMSICPTFFVSQTEAQLLDIECLSPNKAWPIWNEERSTVKVTALAT